MGLEIFFTADAIEDLRRIGPDAVVKVMKKIRILETDAKAGQPLGGELTGFRKLVIGRNTWRVVFRTFEQQRKIEICEVWAVGARRNEEIYVIVTSRVRVASVHEPHLVGLADVLERLGRLVLDPAEAQPVPAPDPVPDWLAHRLIHIVGLRREEVAAMDLEHAVDRWTTYMVKENRAEG